MRIIPARAGFTAHWRHADDRQTDHPRSRGVYTERFCGGLVKTGSSPLARGLQAHGTVRETLHRIIPARAGFTASVSVSGSRPRDHPRSRGVYGAETFERCFAGGSSPLARGLHLRVYDTVPEGRIIPARAGFTKHSRRVPHPRPDHPRSRGVYVRARLHYLEDQGSSPLARGLPEFEVHSIHAVGIIPARAGFTRY